MENIFRGFNTYFKEWMFGGYFHLIEGNEPAEYTYIVDCLRGEGMVAKKSFGQYIGLHAANGTSIYVRDIFQYTSHKDYLLKSFIAEVIFIEEEAAFGYRVGGKSYPFNKHDELQSDFLNYVTIIGNVFENENILNN